MSTPYFDAHCDTLFACSQHGGTLRENDHHLDLTRLSVYSPRAQLFAVWSRPFGAETSNSGIRAMDFKAADTPVETLYVLFEQALADILRQFEQNSDTLVHCLSVEDAKRAADENKLAAFIAVEGAELLMCDTDKLRLAHERGVRTVNLCWNFDNALCGSSRGHGGGLTERGRDFVRAAQALGVIVDLSHSSEAAFWDTLEIAERPVLAGHSDSRALCDSPRNLTDEQFLALVKNGGAAGLNLCDAFLGPEPDVDTAVDHVEHFLSLGGGKNVCLGCDLDGVDALPRGISGVQDIGKIFEAMLRRGWPESLARDIFYGNLMRVFGEAL